MLFVALPFGFVGALFLGLGLYLHARNKRVMLEYSGAVDGVVVGYTDEDFDGNVRPRVQFQSGQESVTITGKVASSPPAYSIGQKVPMRYPPESPSLAFIADFWNLYLFQIVLVVFGAIALLVSMGLVLASSNPL